MEVKYSSGRGEVLFTETDAKWPLQHRELSVLKKKKDIVKDFYSEIKQ